MELREASAGDAELLYAWVNDPETRRQSLSEEPVAWSTHVEWLADVIEDPNRRLWIAVEGDECVGQVRLDRYCDHELLSISVAPDSRGRGFAASIIEAACAKALGRVEAEVKAANERSLRAFRAAGFHVLQPGDPVRLVR